jgi:hypothetical protein
MDCCVGVQVGSLEARTEQVVEMNCPMQPDVEQLDKVDLFRIILTVGSSN